MILVVIGMTGIEQWLAGFGKTDAERLAWGRTGIALPYVASAAIGIVFLFATAGAISIKQAGWGVVAGSTGTILIAATRETMRLAAFMEALPKDKTVFALSPSSNIDRSGRSVHVRLLRAPRGVHRECSIRKGRAEAHSGQASAPW